MTVWTSQKRREFYEAHKRSYPFEVYTDGTSAPHPTIVHAQNKYGLFVRVPMPEDGYTIWMFTTRELAVMFQQDYKARM